MNHLVSSFCIGKYAPLSDYFTDLTISDLSKLNNNEIVDSFPYQLKLQVRLFLKERAIERTLLWSVSPGILFDYNDQDDDEAYRNDNASCENVSKIEDTNILNLSKKISSCYYSPSTDNIKNINGILSTIGKKNYTYLDFSWNKLYDYDLPYLVNAVKELDIDVKAISLSCNNFSGRLMTYKHNVDENLHYLLEKCDFVDITMNPLASIDRKDFFKTLEQNHPSFLFSLIWIPEIWLETKAWHNMVCKDLHDEVRDSHRKYYRWLATLPLD